MTKLNHLALYHRCESGRTGQTMHKFTVSWSNNKEMIRRVKASKRLVGDRSCKYETESYECVAYIIFCTSSVQKRTHKDYLFSSLCVCVWDKWIYYTYNSYLHFFLEFWKLIALSLENLIILFTLSRVIEIHVYTWLIYIKFPTSIFPKFSQISLLNRLRILKLLFFLFISSVYISFIYFLY